MWSPKILFIGKKLPQSFAVFSLRFLIRINLHWSAVNPFVPTKNANANWLCPISWQRWWAMLWWAKRWARGKEWVAWKVSENPSRNAIGLIVQVVPNMNWPEDVLILSWCWNCLRINQRWDGIGNIVLTNAWIFFFGFNTASSCHLFLSHQQRRHSGFGAFDLNSTWCCASCIHDGFHDDRGELAFNL